MFGICFLFIVIAKNDFDSLFASVACCSRNVLSAEPGGSVSNSSIHIDALPSQISFRSAKEHGLQYSARRLDRNPCEYTEGCKKTGAIVWGCGVQWAWQVMSTAPGAEFTELQPKLFLNQALEILLKQDQNQGSWQGSWIDDTLGDIAEVQMCAGDLGGALKTILNIKYTYRRDALLFQLAEAFVQRGNRLAAVGVTFFIEAKGPTYSCQDTVSLGWVQRLLEIGNLSLADKEVHKLKLAESRIEGLLKLAMVYSKMGNGEKASDYFKSAMEEAMAVKDKRDREVELFTIAKFQIEAGKTKEARSLVEDLFAKRDQKSSWRNFSNCLESAELMAKIKDEKRAKEFFERAFEAQKLILLSDKYRDNGYIALGAIALSQANAGFFADALRTIELFPHRKNDNGPDLERDRALCGIAKAQARAKDFEGAVKSAMSIKYYLQGRDEPLQYIAVGLIARKDLQAVEKVTELFDNRCLKTTAKLEVARAYAKAGDPKKAKRIAKQIDLDDSDFFFGFDPKWRFDYRNPRTWGKYYERNDSRDLSQITAGIAKAAMSLAQALGQEPAESYEKAFESIRDGEVIRALARAHAATGDPHKALTWANQIGSSDKIKPGNIGFEPVWTVKRRVNALIGVAEGILDRRKASAVNNSP